MAPHRSSHKWTRTLTSSKCGIWNGNFPRTERIPDYIGQALVYAGIALLANSWWPLFIFSLVLFVVQRLVIEREERYLEEKFDEEYREYRARVRRWL
jgi:protein-S-isoprenylcysteine O-methyltransferase Ste14